MKATLEPKVLRWAREQAGLSEAAVAEKVGVSVRDVAEWEKTGSIPFEAVETLAQKTHTPFGFLFLREPPKLDLPVADFRHIGGAATSKPSRDLLEVLHSAQLRQNWYREYLIANREQPLPFVGKSSVRTAPEETARDIRETLRIGPNLAATVKAWEEAIRYTIEATEDGGILVLRAGYAGEDTHRKLSVDEFRGFALSDDYAPLVFINGADAPSAQLFTLAHEIAHIWIGASGVSNFEKTYTSSGVTNEEYCNSVAAEVLLPLSEVRRSWRPGVEYTQEIDRLSKQYKVSPLVVARRARDAGFITTTKYSSFFAVAMSRAKKATGGDYYLNGQYRNSRRFAVAIIQDAREGRTMYRDAMRLLGIKKELTFRKFAESLQVGW